MKGKKVQYVIWEYDSTGHDEILRKDIVLMDDLGDTYPIKIDAKIFGKGYATDRTVLGTTIDGDSVKQNYFIEVIPLDVSAESKKFGVDSDGLMEVEKVKSVAVVNTAPKKETKGTCICQEQYKDLVWGGKVSCDFRKKVVEICKDLWPDKYFEMAKGLMAVMNVETRGSFKPQQLEVWKSVKDPTQMTIKDFWKDGKRSSSRAIGLIQFTQEALQKKLKEYISNPTLSTEQKFDELNKLKLSYAQMGEINQLNKVKKYFESQKSSINTPEEIYLAVFAPKGIGKKDDYMLYEGGTKEYNANSSVDTRSKGKYKNDGNIQRSEILERYHDSIKEGLEHKPKDFSCSNAVPTPLPKVSAPEDKDMLSKYLSYAQAIKSDTAKKNGLDNTPTANEKENLKQLGLNVYDKIYEKFNGNVKLTSVFRNEAVNKKVRGSSTSQHRYGQALDIQGTNGVTNKQIFKYVKENLDYHQIIWEYGSSSEPNWVHVGYKPSGNKKTNTRAVKVSGKTKYKTFDIAI